MMHSHECPTHLKQTETETNEQNLTHSEKSLVSTRGMQEAESMMTSYVFRSTVLKSSNEGSNLRWSSSKMMRRMNPGCISAKVVVDGFTNRFVRSSIVCGIRLISNQNVKKTKKQKQKQKHIFVIIP